MWHPRKKLKKKLLKKRFEKSMIFHLQLTAVERVRRQNSNPKGG
ncbi:hypothetical protein RchiOBHm_Chr7g0235711 [Rosa chinensis]|uniref:Uncharacterized protein n=1 Tax=Rosa chinensis TaxID=74649 RepID=A0A2P6PGR8_ROSCH|nr:hypothetical protein RchiOBHm_Chr7g0235711 [Rosa chinensis]